MGQSASTEFASHIYDMSHICCAGDINANLQTYLVAPVLKQTAITQFFKPQKQ